MMRVISGKAKGRKLKSVPGDTTRPIMDRAKENLFNILGDWVIGTRWLDLFAGTGQVGIEALSRNASEVVFVETAVQAVRTVEQNLILTKLTENAHILKMDAMNYLEMGLDRAFDVIFVAPPQYHEIWSQVLLRLDENPTRYLTLDEEGVSGIIVVQIDPKEFRQLSLNKLSMYDQRKYGRTMFCFYEIPETSSSE